MLIESLPYILVVVHAVGQRRIFITILLDRKIVKVHGKLLKPYWSLSFDIDSFKELISLILNSYVSNPFAPIKYLKYTIHAVLN